MRRHRGCPGRGVIFLAGLLAVLAVVCDVSADEEPEESSAERSPRHRIDFGVQWFDAAEGDIVTGSLNYSWVPLDHHAFAATMSLVGSGLSESEGSGIGDTRLQYSWVPSAKITASAWVPATLGMGFGLIVPTGDPAKGTGADRWVAIPTLGWVFTIGERFAIQPGLQYLYSFNEGAITDRFRSANLELKFLYVSKSGFWIDYTPSIFRDFEPFQDTNVDHFLTFGKQFTKVFGGSFTLGSVERPPIQQGSFVRDSDQFGEITLHFVLP